MRKKMAVLTFLAMVLLLVPLLVQSGPKKSDLEARIAALEAKLEYVTVETDTIKGLPGPHIIIEGANLHIRNGEEEWLQIRNGLGNLIVGTNEEPGEAPLGEPPYDSTTDRMASHVVVIGEEHIYTSFGGLVAGDGNAIRGKAASVTGGGGNTAVGPGSSVSGGSANRAIAISSSVSGGAENRAVGDVSWVGGGLDHNASGVLSSVSGGFNNSANGDWSSVSGGADTVVDDNYDWAAAELYSADSF